MRSVLKRLLHDTSGATAVEYGLLIGVIAMSVVIGAQNFVNQLVVLYQVVNMYTSNASSSH